MAKLRDKLLVLLRERRIPGSVFYSRRRPVGWMHALPHKSDQPQRMGYDFRQAVDMITSGTLDFMSVFTGEEVYVVMAWRGDRALPKIQKAINDRIFHTVDDAVSFIAQLKDAGYDPAIFGVFKVFLEVRDFVV